MRNEEIDAELKARADHEMAQVRLVVDYYRIRRRLSYPLRMQSLPIPRIPPYRDDFHYPWATWLSWRMEERIHALGGWGHVSGNAACRATVAAELQALTAWPRFDQYDTPDLSTGHQLRILVSASRTWDWLSEPLHASIRAACERQVNVLLSWFDKHRAGLQTAQQINADPNGHRVLANIPVIGTFSLAMAADLAGHHAAGRLHGQAAAHLHALLDRRLTGHTEAVAYDGYVLDFALWWLASRPESQRREVMSHRAMPGWIRQPAALCLPGDAAAVATLGDVEPREMPFHFTASARALHLCDDPVARWHLEQVKLPSLRADALPLMRQLPSADHTRPASIASPATGANFVHYAVTLRSGWQRDDLTVAASAASADMGHLHMDAGSIVMAIGNRWIIDDPGYQQYLQKRERTFSVGPRSHNAPLINGQAQTLRQPKVLHMGAAGEQAWLTRIDLTRCYDPALNLRHVMRQIWMLGRSCVVVADDVQADAPVAMSYCWHGHPDAAWWVDAGRAIIQVDQHCLTVAAAGLDIDETWIDRQSGSRGQLTLAAAFPQADSATRWWIFSAGVAGADWTLGDDGRSLRVQGRTLTLNLSSGSA